MEEDGSDPCCATYGPARSPGSTCRGADEKISSDTSPQVLAARGGFATDRVAVRLATLAGRFEHRGLVHEVELHIGAFPAVEQLDTARGGPSPSRKPLLRRLREDTWPHICAELAHYKTGTQLFAYEAKVSSRYLAKLVRGHALSRREYRQLRRTVSDLFRLVPFLIILVIPFAELTLPVLLRVFPTMLPSTFEKSGDYEERKRRLLQVRLGLAQFLQETVAEMAVDNAGNNKHAVAAFTDFFKDLRSTGRAPDTAALLAVARQFEDELTLENLSRPQLVSMCRYMALRAVGTDAWLRYQLRAHMRHLHTDDQMIYFEGVDALTIPELQRACAERGIKHLGVSPARLRFDLQQWLDLHLVHHVPSTLLLLSRAFMLTDRAMPPPGESSLATAADALQATLQALPEGVISEAQVQLADRSKSYKERLDALRHQEDVIAEELAKERVVLEAARRHKERLAADAAAAAASAAAALTAAAAAAAAVPLSDTDRASTTVTVPTRDGAEGQLTLEQIKDLSEAVKRLMSSSSSSPTTTGVSAERRALEHLMETRAADLMQYDMDESAKRALAAAAEAAGAAGGAAVAVATAEQNVADAEARRQAAASATAAADAAVSAATAAGVEPDHVMDTAAARLEAQVDRLLAKISRELDAYDSRVGARFGHKDVRGQIAVVDLERALRTIRNRTIEDEEVQAIVARLDRDRDGMVALSELAALERAAACEARGGEELAVEQRVENAARIIMSLCQYP
ncbi:hypothetical protein AMAG_11065 [Allomyces macrogynus ATCC 38327]|uniref:Letm1 RBD domain-containing protein n=1 Tax=Allomyces macrogynus (strain ATCC 38327) TaxID=578462 RepID=A0A0L0SSE7_ALLM3|nr:hypothetical protein AMAG_11065 [Allomyces macrogynus ATCC 38327]|eukprot:KNE65437.1 hypothetical protein AMAG_11065 [Allomyces macrogynus ATCC 38327]